MMEDEYLGDGVYASFDGYHIVLDLRRGDSTTRIALGPQVLEALDHYKARVALLRTNVLSEDGARP